MKFIGIGYNILDGNPLGDSITDSDPGINPRRILSLSYKDGHISKTRKYKLPDQVDYIDRKGCQDNQAAKTIKSTKEYQKELSNYVKAEGGYEGVAVSAHFSASAAFKSVQEGSSFFEEVYISETATCLLGEGHYKPTFENKSKNFLVDKIFLKYVTNLKDQSNSKPSDEAFVRLFDEWGTHVITGVQVGSRFSSTLRTTRKEMMTYAMDNSNIGLSAGGNIYGGTFSLTANVDTLASNKDFTSLFEDTRVTKFIGSSVTYKESESRWDFDDSDKVALYEPIHISIIPIYALLESSFSSKFVEMVKDALSKYPSLRKVTGSSENNELGFKINWPNFNFALPQSTSGCPFENYVTWDRTMIHQDNEDGPGNTNTASYGFSTHIHSKLGVDTTMFYCSHDALENTDGENPIYAWPKGKYCILRKNSHCPPGFEGGRIHWDDEDTDNKDNFEGSNPPDGAFTKDVELEFCCKNDKEEEMLFFPTKIPFVLYTVEKDHCPKAYGMNVILLHRYTDDEDDHDRDKREGLHPFVSAANNGKVNTDIQFCYYSKKAQGLHSAGQSCVDDYCLKE